MKRKIIIAIAVTALSAVTVAGLFLKQPTEEIVEASATTSATTSCSSLCDAETTTAKEPSAAATTVSTSTAAKTTVQSTARKPEVLTEKIGGCDITYDPSNKALYVKGINLFGFHNDNWNSWIKTAEKLIVEEGVLTIDEGTFRIFDNLKTVELPSTLTEIEDYNFEDCPKLKSINMSKKNPYFTSENGILYNKDKTVLIKYPADKSETEYSFPDTLTQIYRGAFFNNNNLKSISVNKNTTEDLDIAFRYCYSLEKIEVDPENTAFCSDSQGVMYTKDMTATVTIPYKIKEFVVPESVSDINNHCSNYCDELTKITFHKNSINIEENLFLFPALVEIEVSQKNKEYSSVDGILYNKRKTDLLYYPPMKDGKTFTVPNSVKNITNLGGQKLETILIPDNVRHLDYSAFLHCKSLKNITIGKGLEKIDFQGEFTVENENPFCNSPLLEKITVSEENKYFYSDPLGALYTKDMKNLITVPANGNFTEYRVPDSVDRILNCFAECGKLEKLIIGSNVKYICVGEEGTESILGFYECVSLKEIIVSDENPYIVSVDGVLFSKDMTELCLYPASKEGESYSVPDSVKKIGDFAFAKNKNLKKLYVPADTGFHFLWEFTNENYELLIDVYCEASKEQYQSHYLADDPKMHFNAKGLPD